MEDLLARQNSLIHPWLLTKGVDADTTIFAAGASNAAVAQTTANAMVPQTSGVSTRSKNRSTLRTRSSVMQDRNGDDDDIGDNIVFAARRRHSSLDTTGEGMKTRGQSAKALGKERKRWDGF